MALSLAFPFLVKHGQTHCLSQERKLMTVDDDYEEPLLTVVEVRHQGAI